MDRRKLMVTGVLSGESGAVDTRLFYDQFTDTNGVALPSHVPDIDIVGGGWIESSANSWDIQSNQARCKAASGYQAVVAETNEANVVITVDLSVIVNTTNVIARYASIANHWQIIYAATAGTVAIYERNTFTQRAIGNHAIVNGDTAKVVCNGQTIQAFVNDDLVCQYTSASVNLTATKHGFGRPASTDLSFRYDNFEVRPF